MCGVFFSIGFENPSPSVIDSVTHRGPDGRGWNEFTSSKGPVVLAHRRLSIIDLSEDGHQPMSSKDGRHWVAYNGEIYNYIEIRKDLEDCGHTFRTKTDTEVLLKAYLQWGEDCLHKFNGMFAFIIWDDKEKKIFAARDRFGVKPLYYYRQGDKIAFASEIKQFTHLPGFEAKLNQKHLSFFVKNKFHPTSESTLFQNVYHIEPGKYFLHENGKYVSKVWYTIKKGHFSTNTPQEEFLSLFQDSIQKRLMADVPVGALLSGGLDSSSIVCMIKNCLKKKESYKSIQTFTSWSPDPLVNEKEYSDAVIEKTGLSNCIAEIKNDSLQTDIENIIYHHEEPFISTSIQSEWNIYKTMSEKTNLKVALDGQGSDELICGYLFMVPNIISHYLHRKNLGQAFMEFYYSLKQHKVLSIKTLSLDIMSKVYPMTIKLIQKLRGKKHPVEQLDDFKSFQDYQIHLIRRSIEPQLRWQDRSSMAFSVESRQPFLDYRLVEFFLSLPLKEKYKSGMTKVILRKAMKGILPEKVRRRVSKFGFPSPQSSLMQGLDSDYIDRYYSKGRSIIETLGDESIKLSPKFSFKNTPELQDSFMVFSVGLWSDKFQVSP